MSNWTFENVVFGTLLTGDGPFDRVDYNERQQYLIRAIQAAPNTAEYNYTLDSISIHGPGVRVDGGGYYVGLLLTDESEAAVRRGLYGDESTSVVVETRYENDVGVRIISIGGEVVDKCQFEIDHSSSAEQAPVFEGRTPAEQHFFALLRKADEERRL